MGGLTVRGPTVRLRVGGVRFLPELTLSLPELTLSALPSPSLSVSQVPCLSPQARPVSPPSPPWVGVLTVLPDTLPGAPARCPRSRRVRSRWRKTRVRLRRTWRVTGNTGLTYEV